MNEVASKWEKTGLLEGLPEDQKEECSDHLENMACLLIRYSTQSADVGFFNESFAGMAIPIVRRLYDSPLRSKMPDIEWLCLDFASYVKKSKLKREDHYTGMDYEAELCAEYTENLVKRKSKI